MKHINHLIYTFYLSRFIEFMQMTSRKKIPRGCREQYNPGLLEELLESIKKLNSSILFGDTTIEAGTRLVDRMMEEKKK